MDREQISGYQLGEGKWGEILELLHVMVWVDTREMKEDHNRVCPQGAHSQEYEEEY